MGAVVSGLWPELARSEEMMAERSISIDHSTIHRWVGHFSPILLKRFNCRKRAVGGRWHMDET
jgi:putative transposase